MLVFALACGGPGVSRAPHRYLALGDSFTIGTGVGEERSFPAQLVRLWHECGIDVALANPAVNGYTTGALIEAELPLARTGRPTIVTLAIGANDIVRRSDEITYRSELRRIFAELVDATVSPFSIYALPQPDWSLSPAARGFGEPAALRASIDRFNLVMRSEAERAAARYIDLGPLMRRQAEAGMLAADRLHPSAEALAEWALQLAAEIDISGPRWTASDTSIRT